MRQNINLFCKFEEWLYGLRNDNKRNKLSLSICSIFKFISFSSQIYWLFVLLKQYNDTKTKDPIKLLIVNWITEVLISFILYIIICFKYCNLCLILQDVKDNIKKSDKKKFHRINSYLSFTWFLINLI